MKTILGNIENKQILLDELPALFRQWTGRDLSVAYDLYDEFECPNTKLFQKYPEYFEVSLDVEPKLKLKQIEYKAGEYPINFPKEYFEKEYKNFELEESPHLSSCRPALFPGKPYVDFTPQNRLRPLSTEQH